MAGPNPLIYPLVMTQAGPLPVPPATLLAQLIQLVTFGTDPTGAQVMQPDPGYTAVLPGSLIEDISSTDTATLVLADQARVELINSMTPFGCNAFLLNQLGQIFGVPLGTDANMSVGVVFSGTANFIIQAGFQVGDGTHVYIVQTAGVIGSGGESLTLTAVAADAGTWPVAANTVTQIVTSVDGSITIAVNNPLDGRQGTVVETEQEYRLRVLQASVATCQGTPAFLKTLLMAIPGVVPTQVAVVSGGGGTWKVICGGSNPDPTQIAAAIYLGVPNLGSLVGSEMLVDAASLAATCQIDTNLTTTGLTTGDSVTITGATGMVGLNATWVITVNDLYGFTIPYDSSMAPAYTGGGVITPNPRNNLVTINDYPDNYEIPFVTPPAQTCAIHLAWAAATAFASASVWNQLAQVAIVNFINAIPVSAPINILAMQEAVQAATAELLPISQLGRMEWTTTIDGVPTSPDAGTYLVQGDPESYFVATAASVTVAVG